MPQTKVGPGLLGNPNILRFQFTSRGIGSISVVGQLMCWSSRLAFGKVLRLAANDDTFKDFVILCTTTQFFFTRKPIYNLPVDTDTWVSSSQNIQIHLENLDSSSIFIISLLHWTSHCPPWALRNLSSSSEFPYHPGLKGRVVVSCPVSAVGRCKKWERPGAFALDSLHGLRQRSNTGISMYFLYCICIRKHVQI